MYKMTPRILNQEYSDCLKKLLIDHAQTRLNIYGEELVNYLYSIIDKYIYTISEIEPTIYYEDYFDNNNTGSSNYFDLDTKCDKIGRYLTNMYMWQDIGNRTYNQTVCEIVIVSYPLWKNNIQNITDESFKQSILLREIEVFIDSLNLNQYTPIEEED
jgi:hypothetical protein